MKSMGVVRGFSCTLVRLLITVILIVLISTPTPAVALGSRTLAQVSGVTRAGLVNWLDAHRNDAYYLGTPYVGGDWRSPAGDPSFNGSVGMNCTGFVWHALTKAGASGIPGIVGWLDYLFDNDLEHYNFPTKSAMLSSGVLEKGDVIWVWDGDMFAFNPSHHVGIFWGESSTQDVFWHSNDTFGSNVITAIAGKSAASTFTVVKIENKGNIDLVKRSSWVGLSENNTCYNLAGAVYTVFSDEACTRAETTLTTDSTGSAQSVGIKAGPHYVKETVAAPGFALDETVYPITVRSNRTVRLGGEGQSVFDKPQHNPLEIVLEKVDSETGVNIAQGGATLAGAQFEVTYYAGYRSLTDTSWIADATPLKTWILRSDDQGLVKLHPDYLLAGNELIADESGRYTIGLGTVVIKEIKAPTGYLLNSSAVFVQHITSQGSGETVSTFVAPVVANTIKRGDLDLIKASHSTFERMGAVTFCITSKTTGESHALVTDANGYASTASTVNPHAQNTNRGETSDDGVWFGALDALDENRGALPFDTYIVEEMRGSANTGRPLIPPFEVVISRNNTTVSLGTLLNEVPAVPSIATSALDGSTGTKHVSSDGSIEIIDTVSFTDLAPQTTYRLRGVLMEKDTGERFLVDGEEVWAETEFTSEAGEELVSGIVELSFPLMLDQPDDRELVVFEYLTCDDKPIAAHEDITDDDQTVRLTSPRIHTTARDATGATSQLMQGSEICIIDTVMFEHLSVGATYTVQGVLMDKTTGAPLSIDSQEITATVDFIASETHGSVEVAFAFETDGRESLDVVVFEYLFRGEREVASHEDITDKDQSVFVRMRKPRVSLEPTPTQPGIPPTGQARHVGKVSLALLLTGFIIAMPALGAYGRGSGIPLKPLRFKRKAIG